MNDEIDPDQREDDARRHGLWGLGVLAMIAVVVVSFMILFTGGKEGDQDSSTIQDDSTLSGALPSSGSHRTAHSRSTAPSSATSSRPRVSGAPNLRALAAGINELRIRQGVSAVSAGPSDNAQDCAMTRGDGPTCVPHFMWTQVDSLDPEAAVRALQNVNESWLLDPTTTRFEIGWSRDPGGRYNCVVLKYP